MPNMIPIKNLTPQYCQVMKTFPPWFSKQTGMLIDFVWEYLLLYEYNWTFVRVEIFTNHTFPQRLSKQTGRSVNCFYSLALIPNMIPKQNMTTQYCTSNGHLPLLNSQADWKVGRLCLKRFCTQIYFDIFTNATLLPSLTLKADWKVGRLSASWPAVPQHVVSPSPAHLPGVFIFIFAHLHISTRVPSSKFAHILGKGPISPTCGFPLSRSPTRWLFLYFCTFVSDLYSCK